MYGMVNKAVEDMVVMHHGEPVWEKIRARAGVDVEVFISNEGYPDELTYNLVAAASELLQVPVEKILIGFGEHWVLHTARQHYGGMLRAGGATLPEFLRNLPVFHTRVAMMFPKLQPPRFECSDLTEQSLKLHYFSRRAGLAPFVIGLMQGVGKMFDTPVTARQIAAREQGADHDVFELTWPPKFPA
jgi:Haem-NO-binding